MSSTNKTTNYQLSQYIGSDNPTYLGDYNGDMLKIDTAMKQNNNIATTAATGVETASNLANSANQKANSVDLKVGDLENLTTTDKSSIVSAINENTTFNGQTSTKVGDLASLNTTVKTNLVNAINEVNSQSTYSTTETVCGKWIDGKTLYRKVISFEFAATNWISAARIFQVTTASIISDIANIDLLMLKGCYLPSVNKTTLPSVYTPASDSDAKYTSGYIFNKNYFSVSLGNLLDNTAYIETPVVLIIEYTKVSES